MIEDNSVPIKTLLVTVFESIVEVFILCLAGYVLSRAGVTDKATQRKLNVINVSLFTPALLFSKVAYSLTPAKLREMWIIPLGFVLVTGLSAVVAWVLARIFRLSRSQTAYAMCASMFQNSNSLPIALIQSLVIEVPGLKWDSDDTKDQMLGRALTYLVLYSTLGMMPGNSTQITHAQTVLSPEPLVTHPGARETDPFFSTADGMSHDQAEDSRKSSNAFGTSPTTTMDSDSPSQPFTAPGSAHSMHVPMARKTTGASLMSRRDSQLSQHRKPLSRTESGREFWGLPEQPKMQRIALIEEDSSDEEQEDEEWFGAFTRKMQAKAGKIWKSVNAFMTVPMYAALLSIFIAMIQPLQKFMAGLKPLEQAIKGAGQCSIPVTLVVLGAFFYTPPDPRSMSQRTIQPSTVNDEEQSGGYFSQKLRALAGGGGNTASKPYPGENKTVFVAVMSRMVIVPALMLPLIALIAKYDLFEAAEDPVFILAAVLLVSSPPALTLAQITQAASGDAFERLISKTISWSYAVLTPPLTLLYVVIGLVFGRL
ncbi:hypothetical protein IAU60_001362 [Kwoniella sp. DSM 27419]